MRRARETAEFLAQAYDIEITRDDRLREIGNNRLDHTAWPNDALPLEYADYWASERPFSPVTPIVEQGETFIHFRARVGLFIEELVERHLNETIFAVCHGGVIEAAFDHIFNVGPWRRCEIWNHNTGVTYFEYVEHPRRETWRLHYNNRVTHLRNLSGQ
jgi:probable phosphoglycerate mutase